MRFIVFDLDETLGYFKQLYYIFSVLKKINSSFAITQPIFNRVLDLYPEFLRPKIVDILSYLKNQKQYNRNTYLIIYTNNTHQNWTKYIISYIEYKIQNPQFFDRTVKSSKLEVCRQHQKKHLDDLFRCIDYSSNSPICYIDNEYHHGMRSRQTYYCKLDGYINNLPANVIAERLYSSSVVNDIIPNVEIQVFSNIYEHYCNNLYSRTLTEAEYKHECRTSQELMLKIRIFFMNSTTHKRRHTYSNQTDNSAAGVGMSTETINRRFDPLYDYYSMIGGGGGGGGGASGSRSRTGSMSVSVSSSNKTKKNRRVL
jgi:hypothetical protein